MGNSIRYDARPDLAEAEMSNGLTSVVISVLCLGAASVATDDREREIATWLGSRDQGVFGLGMVGFDLEQMPWSQASFEVERAFVLRAIDAAKAKTGWDRLDYPPHEESVFASLDKFRSLAAAFVPEHIRAETGWLGDRPERWETCATHGVFVHAHGCAICNDQ
jgi:hypothetical protein